ncbi:MAG: squalene/phytoene synthase family protein [Chloroflexi bacterium]|nr:squalene/phytoene synthase family protein [Chloroflexota bacterium]
MTKENSQILRTVSRTFALSIEQLPGILREATADAYLLLRVSDCLEDHDSMPANRKSHLLRLWADVLIERAPVSHLTDNIADLDNDDPEVHVAQNAGLILDWVRKLPTALQEPIFTRVRRTTLGMARWQDHGPFVEDEAALDDYMHEVAGRVGYLVTDLFAWYSARIRERREQLMPLARQCGLALQTVNVIRGIPKDYERGWVFVPQTFMQEVGLTRDTLLEPENLEKSLLITNKLVSKAVRHLDHGLDYITLFPRRFHGIRLSLMWPFFFAVATLDKSRGNANVLFSEAKIGRDQVKQIILQTKAFGWSNRWLANYYGGLVRPFANPVAPVAFDSPL